jgi:tetratricopeptide (TPR) repeat protein
MRPEVLLEMASVAQKAGDRPRARKLYEAALAKNPRDAEALAGLGDLARAEGRSTDAIGYYQRALAISPSFFPALLSLGDTLWDTGDKDAARKRYADIVDRAPSGSYPARVRDRATP